MCQENTMEEYIVVIQLLSHVQPTVLQPHGL